METVHAALEKCFNCQSFGHSFLKTVGPSRNVLSAVRTILAKDVRIGKQENQSVPVVRGHMLHHTKGVRNTKTGI